MQRFIKSIVSLLAAAKSTPALVRSMQLAAAVQPSTSCDATRIVVDRAPASPTVSKPRQIVDDIKATRVRIASAAPTNLTRYVNNQSSRSKTLSMAYMDGYYGKLENIMPEPRPATNTAGKGECSDCPVPECPNCPYERFAAKQATTSMEATSVSEQKKGHEAISPDMSSTSTPISPIWYFRPY